MSKSSDVPQIVFQSCLAKWFHKFIQEKRALGFHYNDFKLRQLDSLLQREGIISEELPRSVVEQWLTPQPYHAPGTITNRRSLVRQFALFLIRNDIPAYLPPFRGRYIGRYNFVPWIFSHQDIQKLLAAADSLPYCIQAPLRHLILPEVFRLLYGCGLRFNEAMRLQIKDVDLAEGVLFIRKAKGDKDRLVPLAPSLNERLNHYAKILKDRNPDTPFFPAPDGGFYSHGPIYSYFRRFLRQAGIPHGGRGHGPRLHDLRHAMACHRLLNWYREGADLNAKLPVLATYLGHKGLSGTQHYLHLTAEIFPDITRNLEKTFGQVIPGRNTL
jgi:integrase/recombinase XerD